MYLGRTLNREIDSSQPTSLNETAMLLTLDSSKSVRRVFSGVPWTQSPGGGGNTEDGSLEGKTTKLQGHVVGLEIEGTVYLLILLNISLTNWQRHF